MRSFFLEWTAFLLQKTVMTRRQTLPDFLSKIEWDLTNGPLSKLQKLLDTKV